MNPLAIAVQGIGFAVALVALQGIGPDTAVVTPVTPISYNVVTHERVRVYKHDDQIEIATTVQIPPVVGESAVGPITAKGAALTTLKPTKGVGVIAPIPARGAVSIRVSGSLGQSSFAHVTATGQHDMEDEDILAIFLTLLDS